MSSRSIFVAATGQNVGKTTVCLGLVAGLQKRCKSIGYFKPVGQEYVETSQGVHVDKDVLLFQSHFQLPDALATMSPVLFPRGLTRDYLDGKVTTLQFERAIDEAYAALSQRHETLVIEGTGHTGVGSIVGLNNAQVAARTGAPVVLIASGGLGSSFDELALNRTQCLAHDVPVAGVILNRILDDKRDMVIDYMQKALKRWNVPLLGAIPYDPFLSTPTMSDFEQLFETKLLTGHKAALRHFEHIRLVAATVEVYRSLILSSQLIITPASREDIVLATLARFWDLASAHPDEPLETGLILTGKEPPKPELIEQIERTGIPMLYVPLSSFAVLKAINSSTAKIRKEDVAKIEEAVKVVEAHIDFERLALAMKA